MESATDNMGTYPGHENPYKARHPLDPRVDGGKASDRVSSTSIGASNHRGTVHGTAAGTDNEAHAHRTIQTVHYDRPIGPVAPTPSEPYPSTLTATTDPTTRSAEHSDVTQNRGLDTSATSAGAATTSSHSSSIADPIRRLADDTEPSNYRGFDSTSTPATAPSNSTSIADPIRRLADDTEPSNYKGFDHATAPLESTSIGVNQDLSYQIIAVFNAGSCFGRWLPGLVADRYGRFNTMTLTVILCSISIWAFWLPSDLLETSTETTRLALLIIFSVVMGFGSGAGISLIPVCVGQLCETEHYGRYYATCYTVVSFSTLTGIPLAGSLVPAAGGRYWGLIVFTGLSYALSTVIFVWAKATKTGFGRQLLTQRF